MASYADEAIMVHALKQASLTNVIGQRLYHIQAPQSATKPYGVCNIVDPSNIPEEFGQSRAGQHLIQIDFVSDDSKTPCDAFLAAHAFMDIFANLTGTIESVAFRYFEIRGPRTMPASEPNENICIVELIPHYTEP